jgi:hypothetical protein
MGKLEVVTYAFLFQMAPYRYNCKCKAIVVRNNSAAAQNELKRFLIT